MDLQGTPRGHGHAAHRARIAVAPGEVLGLHMVARVAARQMAEQAADLAHILAAGRITRNILVQVGRQRGACNRWGYGISRSNLCRYNMKKKNGGPGSYLGSRWAEELCQSRDFLVLSFLPQMRHS